MASPIKGFPRATHTRLPSLSWLWLVCGGRCKALGVGFLIDRSGLPCSTPIPKGVPGDRQDRPMACGYWLPLSRCRRMVHPWACPDGTTQASAFGSREKPGGPSSGPRWVGDGLSNRSALVQCGLLGQEGIGPTPSGLPLRAESQVPPVGAGLLAWSQAWLWLRPATFASRFRSPSPAASWSTGNHWAVVAGPSPAEP